MESKSWEIVYDTSNGGIFKTFYGLSRGFPPLPGAVYFMWEELRDSNPSWLS
jgi:hypothetical protein